MCFNEVSLFLKLLGTRDQKAIKPRAVNTKSPVTDAPKAIKANLILFFELSKRRDSVFVVFLDLNA
jgi:hypothetical protein